MDNSKHEQVGADQLNRDLGRNDLVIDSLKAAAFTALRDAERRMHAYARELDVGDERTRALEIYENIRKAAFTQKTHCPPPGWLSENRKPI